MSDPVGEPLAPVQLEYGQQAPVYRRRRTILLTVVLIGVVAGAWWSWPVIERAFYMRKYRREVQAWYTGALTRLESPTKLKYTENPVDANNGKFDRSYAKAGASTYTGFRSFGGTFFDRRPLYYGDGRPALAGSPDEVMIFMHRRTTAGGVSRLINISDPRFDGSTLSLTVDQVGPINGDYKILRGGSANVDMTGICGPGEIRIFAGQPDPNDAARFSIPFEARGRRGFIDGVFQEGPSFSKDPLLAKVEAKANANVKLAVRMLPSTQPATSSTAK